MKKVYVFLTIFLLTLFCFSLINPAFAMGKKQPKKKTTQSTIDTQTKKIDTQTKKSGTKPTVSVPATKSTKAKK